MSGTKCVNGRGSLGSEFETVIFFYRLKVVFNRNFLLESID